jgi:hypothetical protein
MSVMSAIRLRIAQVQRISRRLAAQLDYLDATRHERPEEDQQQQQAELEARLCPLFSYLGKLKAWQADGIWKKMGAT